MATVLRNDDGSVVFPSEIPPPIDVPVVTPNGTEAELRFPIDERSGKLGSPEILDSAQAQPTTATTAAAQQPRGGSSSQGTRRPTIARTSQTERPQPLSRSFIAGRLKRGGTNTSALNEAIWNYSQPGGEDETSSSSSSSSDDDDEPIRTKRRGKFKPKPKSNNAGYHGHHGSNPYRRFNVGNEHFKTKGKISKKDGRLTISFNETGNNGYLAKALGASFMDRMGETVPEEDGEGTTHELLSPQGDEPDRTFSEASTAAEPPRPKLNIVVMVIGSRGDIQPFLKLGKILKEDYGHHVRIATHPAFRDFVQKDSGLEFFSVGGDPAELMAFMVKNPGMIPKMETVRAGEIGRRRDQMAEMFQGFWRACINATDDEHDRANLKMMGEKAPFVADAIIANPPCFAHIHCAERLGIPLHLMFTFPYTPTQTFPHPLANIKRTNVDPGYTNFMSYPLVEMMTWQGLGDLVNAFRVNTLGLEPVSTLWAPGQLYRLKVPYTYLWSPGLVPKPKDWGPEIDIAGFVFLDLASSFEPPKDLTEFLEQDEPPIYIGFGSIVVDDPDTFTQMIFEAIKMAGVRALVSKGWGGLGDDNTPEGVYMLENTPHDWLFPRVKAVIHHGGAGTTAIGLKCGKPTMVVPFFGDQQFWGSMIQRAGAGADPVPYKELTAEKLAHGIKQLLTEEAQKNADKIAADIDAEGDGAQNAIKSFHRSLTLRGEHSLRCSILEDRVAVWTFKGTNIRLSALAAELLVERKKVTWKQLRLIRHLEWNDFEGPGEPLTGGATAIMGTLTSAATGIGGVPFKIARIAKRRRRHEEKKSRLMKSHHRSGSGRETIANGKAMGPQTNGIVNGRTKSDEMPNNRAPAQTNDKATEGSDLGQHTTSGEPRSQSRRKNTGGDGASIASADPDQNLTEEVAMDIGTGFQKTGEALASAPLDLTLAIAQGFHNAPRLYGDKTVRRPTRITGIKSGLKAAGEEFVYGIYDGVTGLVVQPYTGARDGGVVGLVKGVGMGLTGFVLKDLAAIFGPFGYTFKGVEKQLLRHQQPTAFIRKARIIQGQREMKKLSPALKKQDEERVMHGWSVVQKVLDMLSHARSQGLKGKIQALKERKQWKSNGAFENVDMAEKALAARQKGESLDAVFSQQRHELEQSQKPRKPVMKDVEEGKPGKLDAEKQLVEEDGERMDEAREPNMAAS
ncbi:MAG: hypothetical protein M1818_006308 [Claussenomyces sp. TS43310]|nr:MAG: hypothetical protein M1818_006308 [Claussenomyces sp. TS43310]